MFFAASCLAAALRIGEERVAAVDDQVARFEQRHELVDDRVHGRTRLDHDHRLARALERAHELLHRLRRYDAFAGCPLEEANFSVTAVVRLKTATENPFALHVEDEVFAHDGESDLNRCHRGR